MPSYVWKYFERINKESARCKIKNCNVERKTKGGSTNGLIKHLKTAHDIQGEDVQVPPLKKQKTMQEFLKFSSFNETIARHVCEYNHNFHQLAKNDYLRASMIRDFNEKLPQKGENVAIHFNKFFEDIKANMIENIQRMRAKGKKFSITADEWTSNNQKRFLNMNLHFTEGIQPKHINFGLQKIIGSCTAANLKDLVSNKFN